ncbi:isoprenyl transferase [Rickettsiales bacterium]|nr:isoprenyl transferase [Rickettsiales bacterium]
MQKKASGEIPRHIAIIMDGNGRWAQSKNLPRAAGHKKGADSVHEVIEACIEKKVNILTLYAFSSENWQRPKQEIFDLMELLRLYLGKELKKLNKNNIRFNVIGDISRLDADIQEQIKKSQDITKDNNALILNIALSYGSRQEIVYAAKSAIRQVVDNKIVEDDINEEFFSNLLYTKSQDDPDLLIRTGGEKRLSNFLLWQSAYAELYFTDILWPDFKKENLFEAISEFSNRERRYGTA